MDYEQPMEPNEFILDREIEPHEAMIDRPLVQMRWWIGGPKDEPDLQYRTRVWVTDTGGIRRGVWSRWTSVPWVEKGDG